MWTRVFAHRKVIWVWMKRYDSTPHVHRGLFPVRPNGIPAEVDKRARKNNAVGLHEAYG